MVRLAQVICLKVEIVYKGGKKNDEVQKMMAAELRALALCAQAGTKHVVQLLTSVPNYYNRTAIALALNTG